MPIKKPSRTARTTRDTCQTGTGRDATNVTHLREHLIARGQGSSARCRRPRLLIDIANSGAGIVRRELDAEMRVQVSIAFAGLGIDGIDA